ncbi:glycosyltransferase family 4 protein [Sphingobium sp. CCH11-B1]|jgi:glycosyltransferase involved in cell wall biosynthesis|uniref:glycosyltransferase family 4 protein n=1 Tax=Sphingobium sp. CCH11-B1 TaxID=1768781 RepID=UPI0009EB10E8|nr:glycosyltransferase family 4 protein [Sphingobium sp. CCH11-B1]MEA3389280.1 glycosyltransferase family 4 protein [Pseudomonadota bacterium]
MKVVQAIPRRMRFEKSAASSVELCVSEWVAGSRYRNDTIVVAEASEQPPILDVAVERLPPARKLTSWRLATFLRGFVKRAGVDVIVTQQHIPTAGRIALFNPRTPVVLQTHNFVDAPVKGRFAGVRNKLTAASLNRLSGITLISDATLARFDQDWPQVAIPRAVVTNGFDFSSWDMDREKEPLIVVTGRANDTKGIVECAEGIRDSLIDHPGWRAVLILSETIYPDYMARVHAALAPLGDRAEIKTNIPYAQVKAIVERSAISIVASKWVEPFGRTALEAHAAGVALISSGTGGLRQISGDAALYLPEVTGKAVEDALRTLIDDAPLRERLAREGAQRVRRLFSLRSADGDAPELSVCGKLDRFLEQVVAHSRTVRS